MRSRMAGRKEAAELKKEIETSEVAVQDEELPSLHNNNNQPVKRWLP